MGKQNPDEDRKKKWRDRSLIEPSPSSQSNGTKPVIIDPKFLELREFLPEDQKGVFDALISSLTNPKPK